MLNNILHHYYLLFPKQYYILLVLSAKGNHYLKIAMMFYKVQHKIVTISKC